jgi:hypothetical protein
LVGLAAACLAFVTVGFVPLGVDQVDVEEFGFRVTLTSSYLLNGVMVFLCVLKGKYRAALIGAFFPLSAWICAIRIARPNSWWARRWYRARGLAKSRRRDARWQKRWDPRWYWLSNFVAGRPTALAGPIAPPPVVPVPVPVTGGRPIIAAPLPVAVDPTISAVADPATAGKLPSAPV